MIRFRGSSQYRSIHVFWALLLGIGVVAVPVIAPRMARKISTLRAGPPKMVEPVVWNLPEPPEAPKPVPTPVLKRSKPEWPGWRGPHRNGVFETGAGPPHWNRLDVKWKTRTVGRGHSSPIVTGNKVCITTSDQSSQGLVCYSTFDGSHLWSRQIHQGPLPSIHPRNSHASGTPVTDGDRIYTAFLTTSIWVTAVDLTGKIVWQKRAGEFSNIEGYGASPLLYEGKLIVLADNLKTSFLIALDPHTGAEIWKTERGNAASYSSPLAGAPAGQRQVIAHGGGSAAGYDPVDGYPLWRYEGLPQYCGNTPVISREMIYLSCGSPDKLLVALPGGATGTLSGKDIVWKTMRGVPYIPSTLLLDNRLIVFAENGVVTVFDALTGRQISQLRIRDTFSASPAAINGTIVIPGESGTVYLLDPSDGLAVSREYPLEGEGFASVAASGANLYVRTTAFLYCLAMASGAN